MGQSQSADQLRIHADVGELHKELQQLAKHTKPTDQPDHTPPSQPQAMAVKGR